MNEKNKYLTKDGVELWLKEVRRRQMYQILFWCVVGVVIGRVLVYLLLRLV